VRGRDGTQKWKVRPKRYWIENIVEVCDRNGIPVFMEKNLRPYYKEDFRREYIGRKPRETALKKRKHT